MSTKVIRLIVWGLVVLVIQVIIAPLLEIGSVRPDLLIIFVLFISYRYGCYAGLAAGFFAGLAQDMLTVGIIGVTALAKSSVAFWIGRWFEAQEAATSPATWLVIIIFSMLVQDFIVALFLLQGSEVSLAKFMFFSVIPAAVYTGVIGYLWALAPMNRLAPERQSLSRSKRISR